MSWNLAGKEYHSRFILGTSAYPDLEKLEKAIQVSQTEICTVAIRRINLKDSSGFNLLTLLQQQGVTLLPNTAACYTDAEAILTAELASEALNTKLVKLEVIESPHTLLPNATELFKATKNLIRKGFHVMAYAPDNLKICQELFDMGCAAIMPLGSYIGSGQGIRNPEVIEQICKSVDVPVILDAGIGTASHASFAMELGCDAVLMNTAIAGAKDPPAMAESMSLAITAGRMAYLAGPIREKKYAIPSSPMEGRIQLSNRDLTLGRS